MRSACAKLQGLKEVQGLREGVLNEHPRVNQWMFPPFYVFFGMGIRLSTSLGPMIAVPPGVNSTSNSCSWFFHIELIFNVELLAKSCALWPTFCFVKAGPSRGHRSYCCCRPRCHGVSRSDSLNATQSFLKQRFMPFPKP